MNKKHSINVGYWDEKLRGSFLYFANINTWFTCTTTVSYSVSLFIFARMKKKSAGESSSFFRFVFYNEEKAFKTFLGT